MKLQTDKLNFIPVSTDDVNNIHELHSLPATDKFNTLGIPETERIINERLVGQNAKPQNFYFAKTICFVSIVFPPISNA